jgi:hypothetical protein
MSQGSSALAIVGKAGSGKSVLAKTIQQGILAQDYASENMVVADWFYCRRKGSFFTSYTSLLTSILYELLARAKSVVFRSYKSIYRRHDPTPARTWTASELEEVLNCLALSSVPIFMVFDAIDEAHDLRTIPLVESLVSAPQSKIKIIILSRPMLQLETEFWFSRKIILQLENSSDLQEVIDDGLLKLHKIMLGGYDGTELSPSAGVRTHAALSSARPFQTGSAQDDMRTREAAAKVALCTLETQLRENSNGVILWLVLMFESLYKLAKSDITISDTELASYIGQFPSEIEPVYTQMVEELSSRLSENGLRKARTILMWVNVVSQTKQFTLAELWDALAIPEDALEYSAEAADANLILNRREAIRNWKDFHRKVQAMCGSFIEILPFGVAPDAQDSGSSNASANSVIQLMHQTVKDFLASSRGAAALSFSEEEAYDLVSKRTLGYMHLIFPPELGMSKPAGIHYKFNWQDYLSRVAFYLDEFRLIEFCRQFRNAQQSQLYDLEPQSQMIWNGFLPRENSESLDTGLGDATANWQYDIVSRAPNSSTSSALGYIFHFSTTLGLKSAAGNLLSLSKLQDEVAFWDIYGDAILNGILFTVLDNPSHARYAKLRKKLIFPNSDWSIWVDDSNKGVASNSKRAGLLYMRRESAILALDNLYDANRGSKMLRLHGQNSHVSIDDVYAAVEIVMDYALGAGGISKWERRDITL